MKKTDEKKSILIVDDSADTLEMLGRILNQAGYRTLSAKNVAEAITLLESAHFDLVITDFKMPQVSGLDLVRHVRENFRDTEVIMVTGFPSIEGAVAAVKIGAEDYLAKPFTGAELLAAVEKSFDKLAARRLSVKKSQMEPANQFGLVGDSEAMQKVYKSISKAATTSATVLIYGESGTGKELVARAIHYSSSRGAARFVPVNCGGIPENLLESELFGYVKGAFTGANETRAGFFQTADGGTIFLDEISEMSMNMQVKFLRVLQEKEVTMIGARRAESLDVRIVAATNKDLFALVKKGLFREDLFYRLNVINIELPALRERGDDIILLTQHFITKYAKNFGKDAPKFSDRVFKVLQTHAWQGNVRELENLVQRLVVMSESDTVDIADLPATMRFSAFRDAGLDRTLAEVEAEYIQNVLESVDGNKTKAAEILGIDRKTLREKLKKTDD